MYSHMDSERRRICVQHDAIQEQLVCFHVVFTDPLQFRP